MLLRSFFITTRLLPTSLAGVLCGLPLVAGVGFAGVAFGVEKNATEKNGPDFYGKINVSLEHSALEGAGLVVQNKPALPSSQSELNSNASRLGVKGETPLDIEGLTAIYQLEYELNVDDGSNGDTAFSQRNTFAGLQSSWGKVIAGKFDTPFKTAEGKIDQFNDLKPDIDLLIGGQNRLANSVQYSSPKLGDIYQLHADFLSAEEVDVDLDGIKDTGLADSISASVVAEWSQQLSTALAYDSEQATRRSVDGIIRGNALRAVANWQINNWEAGVLLQQARDTTPGSDKRDTSYLLSGAWTINKTKLKAQAGFSKGHISEEEGTVATLGADYLLAKNSLLFGYVSDLSLHNTHLEDQTIGVGLSHKF